MGESIDVRVSGGAGEKITCYREPKVTVFSFFAGERARQDRLTARERVTDTRSLASWHPKRTSEVPSLKIVV